MRCRLINNAYIRHLTDSRGICLLIGFQGVEQANLQTKEAPLESGAPLGVMGFAFIFFEAE